MPLPCCTSAGGLHPSLGPLPPGRCVNPTLYLCVCSQKRMFFDFDTLKLKLFGLKFEIPLKQKIDPR